MRGWARRRSEARVAGAGARAGAGEGQRVGAGAGWGAGAACQCLYSGKRAGGSPDNEDDGAVSSESDGGLLGTPATTVTSSRPELLDGGEGK